MRVCSLKGVRTHQENCQDGESPCLEVKAGTFRQDLTSAVEPTTFRCQAVPTTARMAAQEEPYFLNPRNCLRRFGILLGNNSSWGSIFITAA